MYYSTVVDARQRPLVWPKTNNNPFLFNALDEAGEPSTIPHRCNAKNLHLGMRDLPGEMHRVAGMPTSDLAAHYLGADDAARGISSVHYKLRLLHDPRIIVIRMICDNHYAVVLPQILEFGAFHLQIVFPSLPD